MVSSQPLGRPRDADIDARIAAATLSLLAEHGYGALTLESVARTAGVTRPTIYRRWPGKAALVLGVLTATVPQLGAPDTGDTFVDLQTAIVDFVVEFTNSGYSPTVFALHAEARHDPDLAALLSGSYLAPRMGRVVLLVERAKRHGGLRSDLPSDVVRDLLFGPLIYRWLVAGEPITHELGWTLIEPASVALRRERADLGEAPDAGDGDPDPGEAERNSRRQR